MRPVGHARARGHLGEGDRIGGDDVARDDVVVEELAAGAGHEAGVIEGGQGIRLGAAHHVGDLHQLDAQ